MSGPVKEVSCPECGGCDFTGVQYGRGAGVNEPLHPCHVDGVSEWRCNGCGTRVGRWSGRVLAKDEHESPYDGEHGKDCPLRTPTPAQA